jgi:dTDP-4-amino-4,6-dideoxygalactose transaminase
MPAESLQFRMSKDPVLDRRFLRTLPRRVNIPGAQSRTNKYFFFQARNAIYHGLRALRLSPGEVVLLPSYLCSAAIEPVLAFGAKAEFYRIDRDCKPDFADLERRVRPETRAVLAVHYFGFPCEIGKFRELCDVRGLFLIEDCAHVLQGEFGGRAIGTYGDIGVFSWRKFLPLYDGGELVLNGPGEISVAWDEESYLFTLKAAKNLVEQSAEYGDCPPLKALGSLFALMQRGWDRLPRQGEATASAVSVDFIGLEFDESLANLPMSRISRWVFEHSDFLSIMAKRRENYHFLRRELSSMPGIRMVFPDAGAEHCPWVLPLIFEGVEHAHIALRARGIPAVTWGGVRHPSLSRDAFPEAEFLYENLVMLPVHQSLSDGDLQMIVEESRSICRSYDRSAAENCTTTSNQPAGARITG